MTNNQSQPLTIEIADRQTIEVDPDPLISIARSILSDHGIENGELSIALVDDEEIRRLNNQFLQHDYATDVISFVLDFDDDHNYLSGQLIVSTETARSSCETFQHSFLEELALYVIHGCLHLVGFDDHDENETAEMRMAEAKYLARLNGTALPSANKKLPAANEEVGEC